ncbi:MAG: Sec-independent protein translocase protein TatC [Gammaproteobacteria bacterium]|nr:Sec-independent protein translocase protein TatC [Gammaproteobacteria bacterium]
MWWKKDNNRPSDQEQTLLSHLTELRDRLLRSIGCILLVFLALSFFANDIYTLIAGPLLTQLPEGGMMIATEVASTFLVPFKLTFFVSIFIAMPYLLYQAWAFVAPGLYENERSFAVPLLLLSIMLFYLGTCFAFFVIFPIMFKFFALSAPEGVSFIPDIGQYLKFVLGLFFAFGICFEVPVLTILLVKSGITTVRAMTEKRPYVIVGAFTVGMLLTPPDVLSQTLLALPMWGLFELGLLLCRYLMPAAENLEEQESS